MNLRKYKRFIYYPKIKDEEFVRFLPFRKITQFYDWGPITVVIVEKRFARDFIKFQGSLNLDKNLIMDDVTENIHVKLNV